MGMDGNIVVLGCGRVGRTVVETLTADYRVTAVDASRDALDALRGVGGLIMCERDVTDRRALERVVRDADLVVGAMPGFLGYRTLRDVVDIGKDIVDISFPAEDQLALGALARERGVTAVVDCGIAPGYWNMVVGNSVATLASVSSATCYVGGLPLRPTEPWLYKAGYSVGDVLEMYTRPSRSIVDGRVLVEPAMSGTEIVGSPLGDLEAFNTDGLRTMLTTMSRVPNIREKTLRYPGHLDRVGRLADLGMLSYDPVAVVSHDTGARSHVRPIEVLQGMLADEWRMGPDEEDVTVMRIDIEGTTREGADVVVTHELLDRAQAGHSSMARTTGFTCCAVVDAFMSRRLTSTGVVPPEHIGADVELFSYVDRRLAERGVEFKVNVSPRP